MVLVLNEQRQIVFANEACLSLLLLQERSVLLGLRPGEMVGCVHAAEPGNGCGTTEFCRTCGAVQAILSSLRGLDSVQECAITLSNGDALDLRVWTRPLQLKGKLYSIYSLQDISHEKRRRAIERVFFHDILNTAGLLLTGADLLTTAPDAIGEIVDQLTSASRRLVDEIRGQRALLEAETGELELQPEPIDALELAREVCALHQLQHLTDDRDIRVEGDVPNVRFTSDRVLLARVLGNMLKNALEAADSGETVSLG
jgi:signal transduction histidine kinase